MKTITVPISDTLHKKFRRFCFDRDVSMKDAIILAIEILLKNKKLLKGEKKHGK